MQLMHLLIAILLLVVKLPQPKMCLQLHSENVEMRAQKAPTQDRTMASSHSGAFLSVGFGSLALWEDLW